MSLSPNPAMYIVQLETAKSGSVEGEDVESPNARNLFKSKPIQVYIYRLTLFNYISFKE